MDSLGKALLGSFSVQYLWCAGMVSTSVKVRSHAGNKLSVSVVVAVVVGGIANAASKTASTSTAFFVEEVEEEEVAVAEELDEEEVVDGRGAESVLALTGVFVLFVVRAGAVLALGGVDTRLFLDEPAGRKLAEAFGEGEHSTHLPTKTNKSE